MHFPVPDVVKNIRYFFGVVKRATGNIRDPQADGNKKETSQKPGTPVSPLFDVLDLRIYAMNAITRVHPTGAKYTDLGRIDVDIHINRQ